MPLILAPIASLLPTGTLASGATEVHIGIVKYMDGKVIIARNGGTIIAEPNLRLLEGDTVQTGSDGKVGLIPSLSDGSLWN